MQVSRLERVKGDHGISFHTFFHLDASEQLKYNTFRLKRDSLEGILRDMPRDEQEKSEGELQEQFIALVRPYLEQVGLESFSCYAYYGDDKKTSLATHEKDSNPTCSR